MSTRRLGRLFGVAVALVAAVALASATVPDAQLTNIDWGASFGSLLVR